MKLQYLHAMRNVLRVKVYIGGGEVVVECMDEMRIDPLDAYGL